MWESVKRQRPSFWCCSRRLQPVGVGDAEGGETTRAGDASAPDARASDDGEVDGATVDLPIVAGSRMDGGTLCNNGSRVACTCTAAADRSAMRSCACEGGAGPLLTLACTMGGDCAVFTNTCLLEPYEACAAPASKVAAECVTFCMGPGRGENGCEGFLADLDAGSP